MKSESIANLAKALCETQKALRSAMKDSINPFFNSSYANLSAVWDVARKPLTDNGLSVSQLPGRSDASKVCLSTLLMHVSGEWVCSEFEMPYVKQDPQAVGSAITYARRYALAAILGIVADEDDDGNKASGKKEESHEAVKQAPPPKPAFDSPPAASGSHPTNPTEYRVAIVQMLKELTKDSVEKDAAFVTLLKKYSGFMGKNEETGERRWIKGKGDVGELSEKQLPVVYGNIKKVLEMGETNA